MKSSVFYICMLCIVLIFSSCDQTRVFEAARPIANRQWQYADTMQFQVPISDTTQRYNVDINLRHTNEYPYNNLYIWVYTTYPSGKIFKNRVNLPLAEPDGKWYGSGLGDVLSVPINIQQNAVFPEKGTYIFALEQDMRQNPLPEILDIGVRVEKHTSTSKK